MMKVAIVGPESTGKSALAECLATSYGVHYVPEYSREYLSQLNRDYLIEDLDEMARVQYDTIQSAGDSRAEILIADTEILTIKIWSEVKYGHYSQVLEDLWKKQDFDLYLLCQTDLPWKYDVLREVPDEIQRNKIFDLFKAELQAISADYFVVSGQGQKRCERALEFIREFRKRS